MAEFTVFCGRGEPLLGKDTAVKLGVLRIGANVAGVSDLKSMIRQQYPKLFSGVGKLNTKQISLHIDSTATPVARFRSTSERLLRKKKLMNCLTWTLRKLMAQLLG